MAKSNPIVFKVGASNAADVQSIADCDGNYTVRIYNRTTGFEYYTRTGIATFAAAYSHAVAQTRIIRSEETEA